jgi:transposase-like protein
MGPEVDHGETKAHTRFKPEAVRLIRDRRVSYAQASQDLNVHPTQLRNWVKAFAVIAEPLPSRRRPYARPSSAGRALGDRHQLREKIVASPRE